MAVFNHATNRVLNGICEWCGTTASGCLHYKDHSLPMDELAKLESPGFMPKLPVFAPVMPLTEEEKAPTLEAAKEVQMRAFGMGEPVPEKPKGGRPPMPRDPVTGGIIRS
jgi:hypothetical protein